MDHCSTCVHSVIHWGDWDIHITLSFRFRLHLHLHLHLLTYIYNSFHSIPYVYVHTVQIMKQQQSVYIIYCTNHLYLHMAQL
jgi:hypothetical protein